MRTPRLSSFAATFTSEPLGWHARLFREWVLYNALAFTIILATVYLLAGTSLDLVEQAADRTAATLALALGGALLYAFVLGSLQWRVLRQRIRIPRRRWVVTCIVPGFLAWVLVVLPPVVDTATGHGSVQTAYLFAVSQALAFGPLLGVAQAYALRTYTRRWSWWMAANLVSWLVVDAVTYLLSLAFPGLDVLRGDGSSAELYGMLLLTTPLTGRWVLWVTAAEAVPRSALATKPCPPATVVTGHQGIP
ncbi:MAG TPA: hypothetical protein VLD16_08290 [Gaiellaceae bacterium]|nr:hypothetical protein [Gaiellaceae bacterium]